MEDLSNTKIMPTHELNWLEDKQIKLMMIVMSFRLTVPAILFVFFFQNITIAIYQ